MLDGLPDWQAIHWREPLWLLLALQPWVIVAVHRIHRHRQLRLFAESALQPWVLLTQDKTRSTVGLWRNLAYLFSWICFAIAAAGPRLLLQDARHPDQPRGDIMVLVDVSPSMQAVDIVPSRLRRAQIEIDEFLSHAPGYRVGVILFAARAHLYVPLTADDEALRYYLAALNELVLPTAGSRPDEALKMANRQLEDAGNQAAIIMLTDGDWPAAPVFRSRFPVFILGVGSEEGSAIPVSRPGSGDQWLMHEGQAVVSRMDETRLQQVARQSGGKYHRAALDSQDWVGLYDQGIARKIPAVLSEDMDKNRVWHELYGWALAPGLLLLLFSLNIFHQVGIRWPFSATGLCFLPFLFLLPHAGVAADVQKQAWHDFQQANYSAALQHYRQLAGFQGRLGEGVAYYRMENFSQAIGRFIQAVLNAGQDEERAVALFNLGNSYFQVGDYKNAVIAFRDALLYRPDHSASQANLEFSQALQEAVEKRLALSARESSGSGPQSSRAAPETAVRPNSTLSLDDNEALLDAESRLPPLPNLTSIQFAALIEKGLAQVRQAGGGSDIQQQDQQAKALALADARLQMESLQEQQFLLWNRLFEIEEGFPSSLDHPEALPGVPPW